MSAPDPPESAEAYYARVAAATDEERRLAVAPEEMSGWDIFPFEIDSLRIKPLQPLADAEPDRRGEDPLACWCASEPDPGFAAQVAWSNERWLLHLNASMRLPIAVSLIPRAHHDIADLPDDLAEEMGRLIVAISNAIETLPSVGRAQVARYGDGGAHLHLFLFGRPARMLQLRGSPLLDWEENLPTVPLEVLQTNASFVARHLQAAVGGESPAWSEV
jgi:diadenosine tetraphosphate (Ap4A) HIT family hydrolase